MVYTSNPVLPYVRELRVAPIGGGNPIQLGPVGTIGDVYSFAVLMWQSLTLKVPYEKYTVPKMYEKVFRTPHSRPSLMVLEGTHHEGGLSHLLDTMWSPDISHRYSMRYVVSILKEHEEEMFSFSDGSSSYEYHAEAARGA